MNDEQLFNIETRAERATWSYVDNLSDEDVNALKQSLKDIPALVAEVRRLRAKLARGTCGWKREADDTWTTDCGIEWWPFHVFDGLNFCPHCGRGLVLIPEVNDER